MTENNAAQAAQKDWANGVAAAKLAPATGDVVLESATVLEIDALLSKLRAEGVQAGDERALFEWHNRACELTRDEDVPDEYRNSHVQECWNGWKDRAALASAEETRPAARVAGDDASRYLEWDKNRSAWEMPVGTPLFYGNRSPVADESPMAKMADALREKARQERKAYQDSRVQTTEWGPMSAGTEADDPLAPWLRWRMAWRASRATRTPRWPPRISAPRLPGWQAPQASEAVRDQALAALQSAQRFIRNGVEFGYIRMPDADTPDPAHRTPGLIEAAIRALSAQPGAQKRTNGGGEA